MPASIEPSIKTRVIQQWLSGDPRPKIALDNDIGEGTVGSIINYFKIGLDSGEFDSAREIALAAKKQGLNLSDLASNFRLHNFIKTSGAALEDIESFIVNIRTSNLPPEKITELVNQLHDISKEESISPDQVPNYIKEKLEQKKSINDQIQQAEAVLQSKNVSIETINEYQKLNEKLNQFNLSFHDSDKLVNLVMNAKEYGFGGKEIVEKLWNIQGLEWKEKELKDKCKKLSKKLSKYKDVLLLTENIAAVGINRNELLGLKIAIDEAAKYYNLPFIGATMRLIGDIKKYNEINGLQKELFTLYLQKLAINEACSNQTESLVALVNLKSHGLTEDRKLQLNHFLEKNGYAI